MRPLGGGASKLPHEKETEALGRGLESRQAVAEALASSPATCYILPPIMSVLDLVSTIHQNILSEFQTHQTPSYHLNII